MNLYDIHFSIKVSHCVAKNATFLVSRQTLSQEILIQRYTLDINTLFDIYYQPDGQVIN